MRKKLAKNTIASLAYQICAVICGFILPRLILLHYGSQINGLVNSITQFLRAISFLELGVGAVVQSSLYKPLMDKNNQQISKIMVSAQKFFKKLAGILVVYVVALIIVYPIIAPMEFNHVYTGTLIVAIGISMFLQYYFGIANGLLLTADGKGYISYNVQTATLLLNILASLVLMQQGMTIHIVKLVTSLIYLLRPVILEGYVKRYYKIDKKIKYHGEPIVQKWNGVAQHVAAIVLEGTDTIVLSIFADLSSVSVYSVYYLVLMGIKQLFTSFVIGVRPLIGKLWAKQELESLKQYFKLFEWAMHTGITFVFGVTAVLICPFVSVYTIGITDANYIHFLFALLITIANAAHCLEMPYHIMILACGHYRQTQRCYIVAVMLNIIVSVASVKKWGLIGVAIGTLVAMVYQTVWLAWYNAGNLLKLQMKKFIKQCSVDIITAVLIYIATKSFRMGAASYWSWVILAVKVSIVGMMITLSVNLIVYRAYVIGWQRRMASKLNKVRIFTIK